MAQAGERARVARATTRREGEPWGFDVGIFRWGPSDVEIACQFRGTAQEDPRVASINRVFQGASSSAALAAFDVFCNVFALGRAFDEGAQRKLRELRDAGHACIAEADQVDRRPSVA
jgi:hypothetical protein